ncbi:MAG: BLUF domain-containing protein [Ideonella sp.]
MLEQVIYVSRAHEGVDAHQAYDIIRVSHNRNSRFGLTGGLLLLDGYFVQVLEGDRFHLHQRLASIRADPRHGDFQLRWQGPIDDVCFAEEWMALRLDDGVSPALRESFGYVPGLPEDRFSGPQLLSFVLACCLSPSD